MSSASMITKKDSNGKVTGYVVRWRNPAGMLPRQPKRTFKKSQKQLAERFLATVSFRLSAGEAGLAIESPLSLREFYEQTFLPRREKETDAKTNEGRASFWGKWIEPNLGGIRIGQVKPIQPTIGTERGNSLGGRATSSTEGLSVCRVRVGTWFDSVG
jgi:hypothetical protein